MLRTFCQLGNAKVALQVLKEMEFYQESPKHPIRSAWEDTGNEDEYPKPIYHHSFLAQPISLLGDTFGLKAAKEALQESRNHIYIKDERVRQQIETYFKEKFGEEAATWAQSQMTYRVKFGDICVVS